MRTFFATALVAMVSVTIAMAGEQTLTTKAQGNCGSCKKRITKAAKSVDGVTDVAWDKSTKVLTVKYDDAKAKPEAIKKAVVDAGHDVENLKATTEAYDELPDCCKYRDGDGGH
ncbi:MAG: heavy-metal-associated domain-containing protein [Candidatus Kapabacteria bacterium]|nr:heavy-metal-associated domain-containing protein [Candidatus Kapabacteria bacterium]